MHYVPTFLTLFSKQWRDKNIESVPALFCANPVRAGTWIKSIAQSIPKKI